MYTMPFRGPYQPGQSTSLQPYPDGLVEQNMRMDTDSSHSDPQDGGKMHVRIIGKTAQNHIDISNKLHS
jgi:hypothetical protein